MARRGTDHAADAGGDPATLAAKQALREEVWAALDDRALARFPGAWGRIPNVVGAADAAERLRATGAWRQATAIKANPDAPQWPVRQRALADGLAVYVAVPRLAEPEPFLRLDPAAIAESPRAASSIKGAVRNGTPVAVEELEPLRLAVVGCVGVDATGARLGKGGGFADLELALAAEAGLVDDDTVIATTLHPAQVLEPGRIPVTAHDVRCDLIATPDEVVDCRLGDRPPPQLLWDELTDAKVAAIPLLARLAEARR